MKAKPYEDPIVEKVRKVKEALAAKFNFDLHAMVRDQQQREKRYGKRLVSFVKKKPTAKR